ncbi:flippase [Acidithiobacillus albertensis]|uniref:flippase n=1 Tax=Acidithiobacillus albertensis TaxID=119978 RepID=UPI00094ADFB6|nr:flippase [Acidithiobacillus albertensis]
MSIKGLLKDETKKISYQFLFSIGTTATNLFSFVILARNLNAPAYGLYVYILSLVGLTSVIASFGMPTLLIREVARFYSNKLNSEIKKIIIAAFIMLTIGTVLVGCAFFVLMDGSFSIIKIKASSGLILISIFLLFVVQINNLLISVQNGMSESLRSAKVVLISSLLFLLSIFVILIINIKLDTSIVLIILTVTTILSIVIQSIQLRSIINLKCRANVLEMPWKFWLSEAFPLLGAGLAFSINSQIDMVLLGIIKGSDYTAIYQVGVKMASVLVIGLGSLAVVYQPLLSKAYFSGNTDDLKIKCKSISRIAFVLALSISIILIPMRSLILQITFGTSYIEAGQVMVILVVARLFNASVGAVGPFLSMTQKSKVLFIGLMIESVFNVFLNLMLIPDYGYVGAALSTGISMIIVNIALAVFIKKKYGISMFVI